MKKRLKLYIVILTVAISAGLSTYYFIEVSQPWYTLTNAGNYEENISGDSAVMLYNDTLVLGNDKKDLKFFDLSADDPFTPTDSFRLSVLANHQFEIIEDLLYTVSGYEFFIVNITDHVNNGFVVNYSTTYYIDDFCLDGDLVYLASSAFLIILNISTPSNITILSQVPLFYGVHGITIQDNLLYIAETVMGVRVYNVTDPTSPQIIAQMRDYSDIGLETVDALNVRVSGDLVLIMDTNSGLIIYDHTSPGHYNFLSNTLAMGNSKTFVLVDNLVYVGGLRGLRVIDISDPSNPLTLGEITERHRVLDLVAYESNSYIIHSNGMSLYQLAPGVGPNPINKQIAIGVITGFLQVFGYITVGIILVSIVHRSKVL